MPKFRLGANVHENVSNLRVALGTFDNQPLSYARLARAIAERHPEKDSLSPTTVQNWERETEPDIQSGRIMAELAGVTFQQFMLGVAEVNAERLAEEGGAPAVQLEKVERKVTAPSSTTAQGKAKGA